MCQFRLFQSQLLYHLPFAFISYLASSLTPIYISDATAFNLNNYKKRRNGCGTSTADFIVQEVNISDSESNTCSVFLIKKAPHPLPIRLNRKSPFHTVNTHQISGRVFSYKTHSLYIRIIDVSNYCECSAVMLL